MRFASQCAVFGVLTLLAGCKTCDLVEAELRYESRRARQLERCLCQKQAEVETLKEQLAARESPSTPGTLKDTSESAYRRTAMSRVSLGLGTGARDVDRDGANESVQFTVVCHDYDGDAFKCPGAIDLKLVALPDDGSRVVVGEWTIDPDLLRQKWKSSVVGSGYQVIEPVVAYADAKKWRLSVRFTTLDGRAFQDERDVEMKLTPAVVHSDSNATTLVPTERGESPGAPSVQPSLPPATVPDESIVPSPPATPPDESASRLDMRILPMVGLTELPPPVEQPRGKRRTRLLAPVAVP